MVNEIDVRKKLLKDLMGQMDNRMAQRAMSGMGEMSAPVNAMAGEQGNLSDDDMEAMEGAGEDDELTRRLRQAAMMQ